MLHFITLTASVTCGLPVSTYRICTDRIDWMADFHHTDKEGFYTLVSVNGKEIRVEEPVHVILTYIKNPDAPHLPIDQIERNPCCSEYEKKYGKEEGRRRYMELMHYPGY